MENQWQQQAEQSQQAGKEGVPPPARIPVESNKKAAVSKQALPAELSVTRQTQEEGQVLLVEDDQFLNSLLKGKLEKLGVSVQLATDGETAIEILNSRQNAPRLVLMDLILPKKSGFEVMEEMQNNPQLKGVPVIILSNLGQDSDVAKGRQLGAVEYYIKAKTSIDELASRILNFVLGDSIK